MKTKTTAIFLLLLTSFLYAKDKPKYQVGVFVGTSDTNDGTITKKDCVGLLDCGAVTKSLGRTQYSVRTPEGDYIMESPVNSLGKHQPWFMDNLAEGDKVVFSASCKKDGYCIIRMPNPDKPDKTITMSADFRPSQGKSNATTLCGTGKLSAEVEVQVCPKP